jgi:hypothetical protein
VNNKFKPHFYGYHNKQVTYWILIDLFRSHSRSSLPSVVWIHWTIFYLTTISISFTAQSAPLLTLSSSLRLVTHLLADVVDKGAVVQVLERVDPIHVSLVVRDLNTSTQYSFILQQKKNRQMADTPLCDVPLTDRQEDCCAFNIASAVMPCAIP